MCSVWSCNEMLLFEIIISFKATYFTLHLTHSYLLSGYNFTSDLQRGVHLMFLDKRHKFCLKDGMDMVNYMASIYRL